jgi:glycine/D-amino acid oxidase-like deaminating enzyme
MPALRKFRIIGAGLAGCTLAWQLHWRGCRVRLLDAQRPGSASRIAAGIINPVTGKRFARMPHWETLWPVARQFYRHVESITGTSLLHECGMVRIVRDATEAERLAKRRAGMLRDFVTSNDTPLPKFILAPLGSCAIPAAARLNVPAFLAATASHFPVEFVEVSIADCPPDVTTIFCTGIAAMNGIPQLQIAFQPAKGELLTVRGPGLRETRILNRGTWLMPLSDGLARVGATYSWDQLDAVPTSSARDHLLGELAAFVFEPIEVVDHAAAVRPILVDREPVLGRVAPHVAIFNGLASKGALLAPVASQQLAEHLLHDTPIDAAWDVRRFIPSM